MKKFLSPSQNSPIRATDQLSSPHLPFSNESTGKEIRAPIRYSNPTSWSEPSEPGSFSSLLKSEDYYSRPRHLPRLLHLFAEEAEKLEADQPGILVNKLKAALRAERRRGKSGHWRYSLARHIGLHQALNAEEKRLLALTSIPITDHKSN